MHCFAPMRGFTSDRFGGWVGLDLHSGREATSAQGMAHRHMGNAHELWELRQL